MSTFQIFITSLLYKTITLDVGPSDTIETILTKIKCKLSISTNAKVIIILKYRNNCHLDPDKTLSYYGIQQLATIKIVKLICPKKMYHHQPKINDCPYMNSAVHNVDDVQTQNICNIYQKLQNYQYSEIDLIHMQRYNHYGLSVIDCKYGVNCKAYKRLINNGHRLDDRCHVSVFSHPVRYAQMISNLPNGYNPFIYSNGHMHAAGYNKLSKLHTDFKFSSKSESELLELLVNEVKSNGFGTDLICPDGTSLVDVAQTMLIHPRHLAMDSPLNIPRMLSIIMYTGCNCNYDLCASQRNKNYAKWICFDYCLNSAISMLCEHEDAEYPVYSGVNNVMLDFSNANGSDDEPAAVGGFFGTFTSTSWDINVAKQFRRNKGVIFGISAHFRRTAICCDVSWISMFSEKEILFTRFGGYFYAFKVEQTNTKQKVQITAGGIDNNFKF